MDTVYLLVLVLMIFSSVFGYCPPEKTRFTGKCSYYVECKVNISDVRLHNECLEATNYPVTVDLTLRDAVERFDDSIDQDILGLITTLRIYGHWPQTKLSLLQYTTRVQYLYLSSNDIEYINDSPFYYLINLVYLDLSHNKLTDIDIFQFESHPNKLKTLSLSNNYIEEIPEEAFEELTTLVDLDLSYNRITDLTEEPFSNLTSLEILRLNNNNIKNLNGAVNDLYNLKHLFLRDNQIENIDMKSLKIINHLETFDLSRNKLEKLNPEMLSRHWKHFGNHSFCKIILSGNHIAFLPNASKEIFTRYERNLPSTNVDVLTKVDLSNNAITNIEFNAFQSLNKMISLDMSRNKLIDFVVNSGDLKHVVFLNLSGNYMSRLYFESFSSMTNLQNLDLSYNRLDNIPDYTFTNNYNLKNVNMTYNDIEKIENLHIKMFHAEGGILDLSNNDLTQLRIPYGEGLRLINLKLHSNNISDMSLIDLIYQNDLTTIDVSNNMIQELNHLSLKLPVRLVYLDLSSNMIERIGPATFHRVTHLRTIHLSLNQLSNIEYGAFQGLTDLLNLDLSFNKITMLDSKVLMDLKSLRVLSLRSNGLFYLDYTSWYSHKYDLKIYVEGNELSCEWLSKALSNYNNGYSKMRPVALILSPPEHSIEGIPCVQDTNVKQSLTDLSSNLVMADDRVLLTSQKILEAVREQTSYLRKYLRRSIISDMNDNKF